MTINLSDNNPRANYTATSGQTAFTIPFDYFDDGDISVYQNGTLKTITTHYTISGSTVTLVTGATAGDKIAITRDVPLERTTDLTSTYNAASINNQLDTIVAQIADLDDRVSRSISLNDYEVGVSLDLPATADRLGKTIQFNSSTGALEVGPSGDELTSIASIASEITALDGISSDITSVAGYVTEINNVGDNIASVTSVSSGISSVGTVSTNIADVNSVAGSITNLNDVADSLDQVELVATSISNVDIVGPAIANINTVAGDITNINTLASSTSNIALVAAALSNINTTVTNLANINLVGNNIDDVNDVANVITKVTTVADNIANVNTVAPEAQYLSDVANNISTISTVAQNISDIQGAITAASNAATSESNAATSETNAATSASNASTSASNAAASASSALSAKTSAESARDATLAAFDSFDDRYLGSKTADPSVDNDGNALVGGALYYNSTDEVMKVYTGSQWVAAYASLSGALLVSNNLSDLNNAASARTNLGLGTAATTDSTDYIASAGGTMTGNLTFGDNNKAIFGAGSDLQIYHDGSNSYLRDGGTGDLKVLATNFAVKNLGDSINFITTDSSTGAMDLYHNGSSKLTTTSTGVDVTGYLTADGLNVENTSGYGSLEVGGSSGGLLDFKAPFSDDFDSRIIANGTNFTLDNQNAGSIIFNNNLAERMRIKSDGNVQINGQLHFTDTGSLIARPTTNALSFNTNGSERIRIDSSGNVGIGTSSPNNKLTIEGSATLNPYYATYLANSYYDTSWKYAGNGIAWGIGNNFGGVTNGTTIAVASSNSSGSGAALTWNPAFNIDSNGNIGIGTSSPSTLLHLDASSDGRVARFGSGTSDTGGMYVTHNSGSTRSFELSADNILILDADRSNGRGSSRLQFNVDGTERMRIDSNGNVGIGASSIASGGAGTTNLNVHTPSATSTYLKLSNTGTGNTASDGFDLSVDSSGNAYLVNRENGFLGLYTNATERMRIDSSGNFIVGGTSAAGVTSGGVFYATPSSGIYAAASAGVAGYFNRNANNGDVIELRSGNTPVGSIGTAATDDIYFAGKTGSTKGIYFNANGVLPATTGGAASDATVDLGETITRWKDAHLSGTVNAANFNTTSDATLKTNVETLTGSLDAVKAMRGVSYDWIESGNSEVGVIAQEVEAIVPDVVSTNDQGIKSVKYGNLVGVLIEAIKEQQAQIDELKAKLGD